jgi:hypothetical protein
MVIFSTHRALRMYFITGIMKASHAHAPAAVMIAALFLTRKPLKRVGSELERGSQSIWGRFSTFSEEITKDWLDGALVRGYRAFLYAFCSVI